MTLEPASSLDATPWPLLCSHALLSLPFCKNSGASPGMLPDQAVLGRRTAVGEAESVSCENHAAPAAPDPRTLGLWGRFARLPPLKSQHVEGAKRRLTGSLCLLLTPPVSSGLRLSPGHGSPCLCAPQSAQSPTFLRKQIAEPEGGWCRFCHADYADVLCLESTEMSTEAGRQGEVEAGNAARASG